MSSFKIELVCRTKIGCLTPWLSTRTVLLTILSTMSLLLFR